ncbi:MAG: radical SAM protein [Desulfurococcales archaeon]|nr:radical SAM protein [Desulfurococcales archaeon]
MPTSKYKGSTTRYIRPFDPWSSPLCTCPFKYSLNPYTGCSHFCLYCYATSYIGRKPSTPKKNLLRIISKELSKVDHRIPINISTSTDPYPPLERHLMLTRNLLALMIPRGYRILITTKSDIVVRDADILSKGNAAVTVTITTLEEKISSKLEPGAPSPQNRLEALRRLGKNGVPIGVRLDPILPYINDDPHDLRQLVEIIAESGATFIVTSTYKAKPDNLARIMKAYPELAPRYHKLYKEEGVRVGGYWYLARKLRLRLLEPVFSTARKLGLEYAHCREGFTGKEYFNAGSCDGTHLIPERIKVKQLV